MDGSRGRAGELLVDDRFDESGEMRAGAPADANRARRLHQVGEDGVAGGQDAGCLGVRNPPWPSVWDSGH